MTFIHYITGDLFHLPKRLIQAKIKFPVKWTYFSLQPDVATHVEHFSAEELRDMILKDADPTMENVIFLQSQRSVLLVDTTNVSILGWIQH